MPTRQELSVSTGLSLDAIETALEATAIQPLSLEMPIGEEDDDLSACIEDLSIRRPEEELEINTFREDIKKLLDNLDSRSRNVIKMRFGIDCEPCTLEYISKKIGLTRERIKQIEVKALKKLKPLADNLKIYIGIENGEKKMEIVSVPTRPDKSLGKMAISKYYNDNREAILKDIEALGKKEALKRWGIAFGTWAGIKKRWNKRAPVENNKKINNGQLTGKAILDRHKFYEDNKAAILSDIETMGLKPALEKWKIPFGTWKGEIGLSERWGYKKTAETETPSRTKNLRGGGTITISSSIPIVSLSQSDRDWFSNLLNTFDSYVES
jgi:RNA polymerase sigma factor (sigma-70 family)